MYRVHSPYHFDNDRYCNALGRVCFFRGAQSLGVSSYVREGVGVKVTSKFFGRALAAAGTVVADCSVGVAEIIQEFFIYFIICMCMLLFFNGTDLDENNCFEMQILQHLHPCMAPCHL